MYPVPYGEALHFWPGSGGMFVYEKYIKRIFDILLSIVFLPFVLIIIFLCGVLVKLEDGGPVLYLGKRLGKNGIVFNMYKLRTMKVDSPDIRIEDGSTWNSEDDPRVTRIGKLLRRSSLDEVPQFLNVIKGDMSIIGPRPDPPDWLLRYGQDELVMLGVLPGITGYNQVYFRNCADGAEKIKNDVYYAMNVSFVQDVKIFFRSIVCVLRRDNIYKPAGSEETIHTAM